MSVNNEVNQEAREEEKRQKKLEKKKKRKKRFKRFLIFCLVLVIGVVIWRVSTYDGLPSGIDRPDVTTIAYSLADPYFSNRLSSGNKKLDQALDGREASVASTGKAFEDLAIELMAQDNLWDDVEDELVSNLNRLNLSPEQNEIIRGLWVMDEANRVYFQRILGDIQAENSGGTDPLSLSGARYDQMFNVMLMTERQAEHLYMSMYRQAYIDRIAQDQEIGMEWLILEDAIESYVNVYNQFLYSAELMAYVDSGDYHLASYYLEEASQNLEKMDNELTDQVMPYYETIAEANGKPSNYISVISEPSRDMGLAFLGPAIVYAKDEDDLKKTTEIYDASNNHEKKMSDAEARACILEMILPGSNPFYGTLGSGSGSPEAKKEKEEDPFGDLMMELILNTKINKNVNDANGRTDVTQSIEELEAVNDESTDIQNQLKDEGQAQRDPFIEALLQKLNDEKVRQYLIKLVRDKQAESKDPLKDLGADVLDFFNNNVSSNKDDGGTSNVRYAAIIDALTAQLDAYGSKYLDKEQLAATYDFINEDLNSHLTDDQKNQAFAAFQSLNPADLLDEIGIKLMNAVGIGDVINGIIEALLSAFTLGFVDFDLETTIGGDLDNIDFNAIKNEYFGKPGALNGNWSGDGEVSQQIQASDVDDLPTGSFVDEVKEEVNLTINKNGSNYIVGIPASIGNATILVNKGIKASELSVKGVDCQLSGSSLKGSSVKEMDIDGTSYRVEVNIEGTVSERTGLIKGKITNTYESLGAENVTSVTVMSFTTSLE